MFYLAPRNEQFGFFEVEKMMASLVQLTFRRLEFSAYLHVLLRRRHVGHDVLGAEPGHAGGQGRAERHQAVAHGQLVAARVVLQAGHDDGSLSLQCWAGVFQMRSKSVSWPFINISWFYLGQVPLI